MKNVFQSYTDMLSKHLVVAVATQNPQKRDVHPVLRPHIKIPVDDDHDYGAEWEPFRFFLPIFSRAEI